MRSVFGGVTLMLLATLAHARERSTIDEPVGASTSARTPSPLGAPTSVGTGTLRLRVVERKDAQVAPVPARVHLADAAGKPVLAPGLPAWRDHFNCDGDVRLDLPPGRYTYTVERGPEYRRASGAVTLAAGEVREQEVTPRAAHRPGVPRLVLGRDPCAPTARRPPPPAPLRGPPRGPGPHRLEQEQSLEGSAPAGAAAGRGRARPGLPPAGLRGRATRRGPALLQPRPAAGACRRRPRIPLAGRPPPRGDRAAGGLGRRREAVLVGHAHLGGDGEGALDRPGQQPHVPPLDVRGRGVGPPARCRGRSRRPGATASTRRRSTTGCSTAACGSRRRPARPRGCCPTRSATTGPTCTSTGRSRTRRGGEDSEKAGPSSPTARSCWSRPTASSPARSSVPRGARPLSVSLDIRVLADDPLEAVEVIRDGAVVERLAGEDLGERVRAKPLTFEQSGWFLVRAVAAVPETFRFASTAPFYVEVGESRETVHRDDVEFFLRWIDERIAALQEDRKGDLGDPARKEEVLRPHREAKKFYEAAAPPGALRPRPAHGLRARRGPGGDHPGSRRGPSDERRRDISTDASELHQHSSQGPSGERHGRRDGDCTVRACPSGKAA